MAFDQGAYEGGGWRTALAEDAYERLGLDAGCTPLDIQASYHPRRKWWELQEQRLKGHTGHQTPLVQRVGPSIAEALTRLQAARDLLLDPQRRRTLDSERIKTQEAEWHRRLGGLVEIAIADDRFLSLAERRQILRQVQDIPRQRAEAIIDQLARAKGAVVERDARGKSPSPVPLSIKPKAAPTARFPSRLMPGVVALGGAVAILAIYFLFVRLSPSATGQASSRQPIERAPTATHGELADVLFATGSQGEGVYEIKGPFAISQSTRTSLFNNTELAWDKYRERLYVSAINGGVVSVLAVSPLREVATVAQDVGWNTYSMALSADGKTLFLTCASQSGAQAHDDEIVALDTATRTTREKVSVGSPQSVAYLTLSKDGTLLYLSRTGRVSFYNAANLRLISDCRARAIWPGRIVASRDDVYVYIAQAQSLVRMRTDCRDTRSVPMDGVDAFSAIEESGSGERVWIARRDSGFYEVDTGAFAVHFVDLGFRANAFAESSDGRDLYVATGDKNTLLDVDISTGTTVREMKGLNNAYGLIRQ